MFVLLLRRLFGAVLAMFVSTFLAFVLLAAAPGDSATLLAGEAATTEQIVEIRRQMGLDVPILGRYFLFLRDVLTQGDLGRSLVSERPVMSLLRDRFVYSATLAVCAFTLALGLGCGVGMLGASRPNSRVDTTLSMLAGLGLSLPNYWVALLLMGVFCVQLRWLPVTGEGGLSHIILPTVCLALPSAAMIARLTRASMLDVSQAAYVRAARAKGVPEWRVWTRHILRNGLVPMVTLLGLHAGHLLSGTFVIETLFALPGLGRLVVQAIFERDTPVIVGAVMVMILLFQGINFFVDVLHGVVDPRVRQEAL